MYPRPVTMPRDTIFTFDRFFTSEDDVALQPHKLYSRKIMYEAIAKTNTLTFNNVYSSLLEYSTTEKKFVGSGAHFYYADYDRVVAAVPGIIPKEDLPDFMAANNLVKKYGNGNASISLLNQAITLIKLMNEGMLVIEDDELEKYGSRILGTIGTFIDRMKSLQKEGIAPKTVWGIDGYVKTIDVPRFLFEFYKRSTSRTNLKIDMSKISYELEVALSHALRFDKLSMGAALHILDDMAKETEYEQKRFVKFLIKNAGGLKDDCYGRYKMLKTLTFDDDSVEIKPAVIKVTSEWMEKKAFSQDRLNGFWEIFEKNPMAAMSLLNNKKTLTEEERELIQKYA